MIDMQPGFGPTPEASAVADFPRTYEEAHERLAAARAAYDGIPTPVVDLPDTPPRTLKDAAERRSFTYWLDRAPAALTPDREAALHIVDAPTPELQQWAADKCQAAGDILWRSTLAGILIDRWPEAVPDELSQEEAGRRLDQLSGDRHTLVGLQLARVRVEIHNGEPVIVPNDYGTLLQEVIKLMRQQKDAWNDRHPLLAEHTPRLNAALRAARILGPLFRDNELLTGGLGDVATLYITDEFYGSRPPTAGPAQSDSFGSAAPILQQ